MRVTRACLALLLEWRAQAILGSAPVTRMVICKSLKIDSGILEFSFKS
ncbi:hypothetical protein [Leptospira ognonensis]|nr:hypothetical protein [Leptospira ognonensis]